MNSGTKSDAPVQGNNVLARLTRGDTVTERELVPDDHTLILNAIIDKEPKFRIDPDTADSMDLVDWIVRLNEELRIIRTDEDPSNVWRAFHQMRYLSTQALLAQTRKDMQEVA